jgi:DNA-directed RNA polymerase specialized sigma24 family protein
MQRLGLSDGAVANIVHSRQLGRPDLCIKDVDAWLRRLSTCYTKNTELREDLVQDCLVYFLEEVFRWIEPRSVESVRANLKMLMNWKMLNQMKVLHYQPLQHRVRPTREWVTPDWTEVNVKEVIEKSSPRQRQVLGLVLEGFTITEVSKILGVSRRTINNIRATMVV